MVLNTRRRSGKTSDPEGFAALRLHNAQYKQTHREATFLAQFRPRPGSDEGDWRRRAVEEAKRALGLEGDGEQASE